MRHARGGGDMGSDGDYVTMMRGRLDRADGRYHTDDVEHL